MMSDKINKQPDEVKSTKDRLREALDRLKDGKPTHPDLIRAMKLGRLRPWSPTVLARESGISKKSFDREESNHKWAWQEQQELKALLKQGTPTDTPRSTTDVNRALRTHKKELEHSLKLVLSENAALVMRLQSVDGEMARKLRERERIAARGDRHPHRMPTKTKPGTDAGGTVVPLERDKKG